MASLSIFPEYTSIIESEQFALMQLAYPLGTQTILLSVSLKWNISGIKSAEGFSQLSILTSTNVKAPLIQ